MNKTMKAFTFKRYGKHPELGFEKVDYPAINANEILVKIYAVGLNPIDNMIPTGIFKPVLHFKLPGVLGSDLSGVVMRWASRSLASGQAMKFLPACSTVEQALLPNLQPCLKVQPP
ncbi:NADPH:quinone reductase-like Zn-dependent oxidoreductase [Erwinia persicina]|nr:NADPH:quinone reductase-like Zn-dependent oxidoreductase [Erwinia persicina]